MSSMEIDPLTGLPKKKAPSYGPPDPWQVAGGFAPAASGARNTPLLGGRTSAPAVAPPVMPDYAELINNDPIFGQLQKDLSAQGISDAAARGSAIQRALVQFGQVPALDGLAGLNQEWLNQDVNDTTRTLAQQNTAAGLSISARQQRMFQDQVRAIKNMLAARGALRSGETGHQLQEAQRGYDQAQYDTVQELLDYIVGAQQGFAAAERARQGQRAQGAESAAGRVQAAYPAPVIDPVAAVAPQPDPLAAITKQQRRPPVRGGGGGGIYTVD